MTSSSRLTRCGSDCGPRGGRCRHRGLMRPHTCAAPGHRPLPAWRRIRNGIAAFAGHKRTPATCSIWSSWNRIRVLQSPSGCHDSSWHIREDIFLLFHQFFWHNLYFNFITYLFFCGPAIADPHHAYYLRSRRMSALYHWVTQPNLISLGRARAFAFSEVKSNLRFGVTAKPANFA